ncbi:hypothetical protein GCM10020227_05190 [Streptomyces flavovirens]
MPRAPLTASGGGAPPEPPRPCLPALTACAAACKACGDECAAHAGTHEHGRICADACRACERACENLPAAQGT